MPKLTTMRIHHLRGWPSSAMGGAPAAAGIEATREIVALGREDSSRVVILTTFDLDEYVYEALKAGASGFLLKRTPAEDLVAGVRVVAEGEALLAPSVTQRLIENFRSRPDAAPARDASELDDLTDREREVLVLVARGMTNGDIAAHLFLSEGTVKTHVKRIFAKLGLHDRTQAVILAYEGWGWCERGRARPSDLAGLVRARAGRRPYPCRGTAGRRANPTPSPSEIPAAG